MRTDVKVGLICAFVLVLAVVAYFTFPTSGRSEAVGSTPSKGLKSDTGSGSGSAGGSESGGGSMAVAPPPSGVTTPNFGGPVAGNTGSGGTGSVGSGGTTALASGEPGPTTVPSGSALMIGAPGSGTSGGAGGGMGAGTGGVGIAPPSTGPSAGMAGGGMSGGALGAPPTSFGAMTGSEHPAGGLVSGGPGEPVNVVPGPSRSGDELRLNPGNTGGNSGTRSNRRGAGSGVGNGATAGGGGTEGGMPFMPPVGQARTEAPAGPAGSASTYTIARGDMLYTIAKKNHVTLTALEAANPGVNPNRLMVGAKIHVPAPTPAGATTRPARGTAVAGGAGRAGGTAGARGATTRPAGRAVSGGSRTAAGTAAAGSTYRVKKGDTLRKIAKAAYGDENMWRRIARTNRGSLANPNSLTAGQVLRLPAK